MTIASVFSCVLEFIYGAENLCESCRSPVELPFYEISQGNRKLRFCNCACLKRYIRVHEHSVNGN